MKENALLCKNQWNTSWAFVRKHDIFTCENNMLSSKMNCAFHNQKLLKSLRLYLKCDITLLECETYAKLSYLKAFISFILFFFNSSGFIVMIGMVLNRTSLCWVRLLDYYLKKEQKQKQEEKKRKGKEEWMKERKKERRKIFVMLVHPAIYIARSNIR